MPVPPSVPIHRLARGSSRAERESAGCDVGSNASAGLSWWVGWRVAARGGPGSPGSWVSGCLEARVSGGRRRGDKESGKERERKSGVGEEGTGRSWLQAFLSFSGP